MALYMYDVLNEVPVLHTHVEGLVGSAATLFTVCGSHRTMTRHSSMLVHQPSLILKGNWKYTDIKDEYVNMQHYTKTMLDIYNVTTKLSYSQLVELIILKIRIRFKGSFEHDWRIIRFDMSSTR